LAKIKPTVLTSRRTVIGNLVFLEGEMTLGQSSNDGIDFSDHVSKVYDFDFYTYYDGVDRRRRRGFDDVGGHDNGAGESIGQFVRTASWDTAGRLIGSSVPLTLLNNESTLTAGQTHTGKSLTGQLSGQANAEATVIVDAEGRITSCVISDDGDNYYYGEGLNIEGGGVATVALSNHSNQNITYTPNWWPHLIDDTTVKIISFYSDNGVGGNFTDTDRDDEKVIKFSLIGKR